MPTTPVLYRREPPVGWIVFAAPERRNALDSGAWRAIHERLLEAGADKEIRVVAFTGEGGVFAAGDDIKEVAALLEAGEMMRLRDITLAIQQVSLDIRRTLKPAVAAVSGWALGAGFELALVCDVIYAAQDARFGFPEPGLGMTLTGGSTSVLPKLIGLHRAKELAFRRQYIDARQALGLGIVSRLVPAEALRDTVREFAADVAELSPVAVGFIKQQLDLGADVSFEQAIVHETELILACMATADGQEGVRSFAEKRTPRFSGR